MMDCEHLNLQTSNEEVKCLDCGAVQMVHITWKLTDIPAPEQPAPPQQGDVGFCLRCGEAHLDTAPCPAPPQQAARPEWPPTSDHELPIQAMCGMWQDAAQEWHEYSKQIELERDALKSQVMDMAVKLAEARETVTIADYSEPLKGKCPVCNQGRLWMMEWCDCCGTVNTPDPKPVLSLTVCEVRPSSSEPPAEQQAAPCVDDEGYCLKCGERGANCHCNQQAAPPAPPDRVTEVLAKVWSGQDTVDAVHEVYSKQPAPPQQPDRDRITTCCTACPGWKDCLVRWTRKWHGTAPPQQPLTDEQPLGEGKAPHLVPVPQAEPYKAFLNATERASWYEQQRMSPPQAAPTHNITHDCFGRKSMLPPRARVVIKTDQAAPPCGASECCEGAAFECGDCRGPDEFKEQQAAPPAHVHAFEPVCETGKPPLMRCKCGAEVGPGYVIVGDQEKAPPAQQPRTLPKGGTDFERELRRRGQQPREGGGQSDRSSLTQEEEGGP